MMKVILLGSECKKMFPDGLCCGRIHSIFDRVINIEAAPMELTSGLKSSAAITDTIFSVVARNLAPAPQRIIIDESDSFLHYNFSCGDKLVIDCSYAPVWKPKLSYKLSYNGANYDVAKLIAKRLLFLENSCFKKILATQNMELKGIAYNNVQELVGRGAGLTPAGDDFLAGVLYSLHFLKCTALLAPLQKNLRALLAEKPNITNRLSLHFLKYALKGLWGKTEQDVLFALLAVEGDLDNLANAVNAMLAVGASSGANELAGIIAGTRAAMELRVKHNVLEGGKNAC
jgi:hypothetical protein